jgi:hypothetical protein
MSDNAKKAPQTGARLIVRSLEGVTPVFAVPGIKIDAVFNALVPIKLDTSPVCASGCPSSL